MNISTSTERNIALLLIISLVVVAALIYNDNSLNVIANTPYQMAQAIPNLQANNTNISSSASNGTSINVVPTVNHPPVVKVGPDQAVNENATVMLVGVAIDPEPDDKVSYSWMQIAGPAVTLNGADTNTPSFTAPSDLSSDTPLKFILSAKDDKGAESTNPANVTITVKHINRHPVADANQDQTVNAGYVVSLDGTKSKDPDGDPITHTWVQTGGPNVTLNGADRNIATFTAPSSISADTDLMFKLTVTDSKNATSTDDVKVAAKYIALPNQPPKADAGTDQTVIAGDTVTLDGSASTDPDGSITSYLWAQIGGTPVTLNGADTPTSSFKAPSLSSDTQLKFSLTVKDDKGAISNPAAVTITSQQQSQQLSQSPNQPSLGIAGIDITPEIAEAIGLQEARGFLVAHVTAEGPAAEAGVHGGDLLADIDGKEIELGGDVILEIDNKTVRKIDDILTYLEREKQVGDIVQLTILRDGQLQEIPVTLAAARPTPSLKQQQEPEEQQEPEQLSQSPNQPSLGIAGIDITPEIAEAVGLQEARGFLVAGVIKGGPSDKAGIHGGYIVANINGTEIELGGDVILEIDNKTVRTINDIHTYLNTQKKVGDNVQLTVLRDGQLQQIPVTLAASSTLPQLVEPKLQPQN